LLREAYRAAVAGAERTREAVARKGRASYVGEASRGVIDPGAVLVTWLFGEE
ncbi:DAK2 domain-containing protein, partial [Corynebacterium mastitidis]